MPYDYSLMPTRIEEWRSKALDEKLTALPPMRESMAAAYAPDGKVYVVGGIGCGGGAAGRQSVTAAFDPKTNTWDMLVTNPASSPAGRDRHTVVAVGPKLYLFGGEADYRGRVKGEHSMPRTRRIFGDMWVFDTRTRRWTRMEDKRDQPGPRRGHTMVLTTPDGGDSPKLVMFGGVGPDGEGNDKLLNEVWVYDVRTHTWSQPANARPINARSSHSCVVIGDLMWVYGGMAKDGALNDLWTLHVRHYSWTCIPLKGDTPGPLYGHAAAYNPWYPTKFYLFGGRTYEYEPSEDLWSFDTRRKAFSCINDRGVAPAARYGHIMVTLQASAELQEVMDAQAPHVVAVNRRRSNASHASGTRGPPGRRSSVVRTKSRRRMPAEDEDGDPDAIARRREEKRTRRVLVFGGVNISSDGGAGHAELNPGDVEEVDEFHEGHVDGATDAEAGARGPPGHGFCSVKATHYLVCSAPPRKEKPSATAMGRSAQNDRSRLLTVMSPLTSSHGTKKQVHTKPSRRMQRQPEADKATPWHMKLPDVPSTYDEFKLIARAREEQLHIERKKQSLVTGKSKLQRVVRTKTYQALQPRTPRLDGRLDDAAVIRARTAPSPSNRSQRSKRRSRATADRPITRIGERTPEPYESEYREMAKGAHARMLESLGIADSPLRDQLFVEVPPGMGGGPGVPGGVVGGDSVASMGSMSTGLGQASTASVGYHPLVTSTGLPLDVSGRTPGQQPTYRALPKCDLRSLRRAFAQTPPPMRFRKSGRVHRIALRSPPAGDVAPWHRPRSVLMSPIAAALPHTPITRGPGSPPPFPRGHDDSTPSAANPAHRSAPPLSPPSSLASPGRGRNRGNRVAFADDVAPPDVPSFGGTPSRPGSVDAPGAE